MKFYNPEFLYLLIPVGAIVAAALIWAVALVWPEARAGRPALRDELIDEMVRTEPKVSSLR